MKYYKRVDAQNKTTTVESYDHDLPVAGAVEIPAAEFNAYIAALPAPVLPKTRNITAELDELKAELKAKSIIS